MVHIFLFISASDLLLWFDFLNFNFAVLMRAPRAQETRGCSGTRLSGRISSSANFNFKFSLLWIRDGIQNDGADRWSWKTNESVIWRNWNVHNLVHYENGNNKLICDEYNFISPLNLKTHFMTINNKRFPMPHGVLNIYEYDHF